MLSDQRASERTNKLTNQPNSTTNQLSLAAHGYSETVLRVRREGPPQQSCLRRRKKIAHSHAYGTLLILNNCGIFGLKVCAMMTILTLYSRYVAAVTVSAIMKVEFFSLCLLASTEISIWHTFKYRDVVGKWNRTV